MKSSILEQLLAILEDKFLIPKELLTDSNYDLPLTGKKLGFTGAELVYLFFAVETAFNVHMDEECLDSQRFNSINGIVSLIAQKILCR